jgi:hypothetical protein
MKLTHLLAAAAALVALQATCAHAQTKLTTLKENIFICVSPEAYDEAMGRVKATDSRDLEALKKDLSEKKQCMFVDAEMVDNIMAPYAIVLERNGTKVQVQFIITFRKRVELLHRLVNRFVLVGWTEEANLEPKTIL